MLSGRPLRYTVTESKPRSRRSPCRAPKNMSHPAHSQLPGCFLNFELMLRKRNANGRVRTRGAEPSSIYGYFRLQFEQVSNEVTIGGDSSWHHLQSWWWDIQEVKACGA
ncbi:MAG: hypothetical protein AVDCRST_MAG93-4521 [uncultured Chloroflexia bacterium]|uniref:Uncharacterized protein n=1 Tax=uncultured Chloroflexia bacterium TaxID=1672391 RepID=A0A6J4KB64_9CHLR|nr:MAG: hypothetical protein AVDCRST_MAG93-4521 [uncultured Chloroflexia bacterium]